MKWRDHIGAGTIFRLGEQKLNDFSVCEDNQIQSITLCDVYFSKKVYTRYAVYNGVSGKAPEAGYFSRIFV